MVSNIEKMKKNNAIKNLNVWDYKDNVWDYKNNKIAHLGYFYLTS